MSTQVNPNLSPKNKSIESRLYGTSVQALQAETAAISEKVKVRRAAFGENFISEEEQTVDSYLVFSDEATFHSCAYLG
jgi:hypothetical protein